MNFELAAFDSSFLSLIILALILNAAALYGGFYRIPSQQNTYPVRLHHLLICFGIYFLASLVLIPFLLKTYLLTSATSKTASVGMLCFFQFIGLGLTLFFLLLYIRPKQAVWQRFFIDRIAFSNFIKGGLTWLISFPLAAIVNEITDFFVTYFLGPQVYEQDAVKFVKLAVNSPLAIFFALGSVIILAPLVEEFLFRGCLQTYLRRFLGAKTAIFCSALIFALFHLSKDQGLGNITLVTSLLVLGIFLGFLYEKTSSLFASIGLHMTFNTISALSLIFYPDAFTR